MSMKGKVGRNRKPRLPYTSRDVIPTLKTGSRKKSFQSQNVQQSTSDLIKASAEHALSPKRVFLERVATSAK